MTWSEVVQLASRADVDGKAPIVHSHSKADVGLSNVDNTSDANKPVSTAQQTALDAKAPKASPTFTGVVTAPSVKLTSGAGAGRVLTSAADGTASWAAPALSGAPGVVVNGSPVGAAPTGTAAAGTGSVAVGNGAKVNTSGSGATSYGHVAIGDAAAVNVTSPDNGSIAVGAGAAAAERAAAVGGYARAASDGAVLGHAAEASGPRSTAVGVSASAAGDGAVAIGRYASASQQDAVAIGNAAKALHSGSFAIGYGAQTTAAAQIMLGNSSRTVVSPNKLQIGPDGALAATLSTRANGSGKTELVVQFATGSPVVIATQP